MDTRYQIEEMVSQDAKGVVFQGTDSVTGVIVAMRRFISSGGGGEPVEDQDRQVFSDAIAVLKKVTHPSLRRVLAGGCDPLDDLPYLVTRWVDGMSLSDLLAHEETIDPGFASHILGQFLDANTVVSDALGSQGLWLETALESMIIKPPRDESEAPVALFWLCPWRWLHANGSAIDISGLAELAESLLGGPRKIASTNANGGLAQWIRQIRSKEISSLLEARQSLEIPDIFSHPFAPSPVLSDHPDAAGPSQGNTTLSPGFDPPGLRVATAPLPSIAARAVLPSAPNHRKRPEAIAIAAAAMVGLILFVTWLALGRDKIDPSITADISANRGQARIDEMMTRIEGDSTAADERRKHIERRGYYTIDEADLMIAKDKQEVTFRGRLARVRMSSSGLTMYLEFSEEAPTQEPRAYAMSRNLVDGIRPEDLEQFVGRQMEIRGPVDIENVIGTHRPRLKIIDHNHVNVLDAADDYELR